jgi:hypothetical protein
VPTDTVSLSARAWRACLSQLNCVRLQKETKYEDTMIATYESTCLPYLQTQMQEYAKSADSELASSAKQSLAQHDAAA